MQNFLIFGLERSGTTSLAALLNSAGPVVQEPFSSMTGDVRDNPDFRALLESSGWLPEHLRVYDDDDFRFNRFHFLGLCWARCDGFLRALFSHFNGIKHVWNPLSRQANLNILEWCMNNGVRLVFHSRRNLARSLLSRMLAQQADIHNFGQDLEGKARWKRTAFEPVDPAAFEKQLGYLHRNHAAYRARLESHPHHELFFEDLFAGPHEDRLEALGRLCQFLDIDVKTLPREEIQRWILRKERRQTSGDILERVPNIEELRHLLSPG